MRGECRPGPLYRSPGAAKGLGGVPCAGEGSTKIEPRRGVPNLHCERTSLKEEPPGTDESGMFVPSDSPPELAPSRLRGLRFSLNSPVVTTEAIPAGPARGALLVHRDARGRLGVAVCVRSLRTGGVVLYRSDERFDGDAELSVGIDAALSFGESLGFLFDDDELEKGLDREDALQLWREFLGALREAGSPDTGDAVALDRVDEIRAIRAEEPQELVLEDLVESDGWTRARERYFGELDLQGLQVVAVEADLPTPAPAPPRPAPRRPAANARERDLPLTKFREASGVEPAPAPEEKRGDAGPRVARLARVRLVKRARAAEPPAAGSVLLRLLSSF